MHYLEDYLEVVETLPSELSKMLSKLRELDTSVHKGMLNLDDKSKTFFTLARKAQPDWRKDQHDRLSSEFEDVIKLSDEKLKLTAQIQDFLDKHLRRLDMDLQKFKFELEADSAGITANLEQKSYSLDRPPTPDRPMTSGRKRYGAMDLDPMNGDYGDDDYPFASPMLGYDNTTRRRKSRALAASLLLQEDDSLDNEDPILTSPSKLYTGTGGKPPLAVSTSLYDTKSSRKRTGIQRATSGLFDDDFLGGVTELGDLGYSNIDPDEERYCLCNQVSYGEMVACDNSDCPIEWFHYGCVGITEPPKGKWYCPRCSETMGSRKKRKN
jgi:PIN domain nuclease of toxin-antitoxin system